jgi:hypothetical protein
VYTWRSREADFGDVIQLVQVLVNVRQRVSSFHRLDGFATGNDLTLGWQHSC